MVSNIFYSHPYFGKILIFTNIFQRGWNNELVIVVSTGQYFLQLLSCRICHHFIQKSLFATLVINIMHLAKANFFSAGEKTPQSRSFTQAFIFPIQCKKNPRTKNWHLLCFGCCYPKCKIMKTSSKILNVIELQHHFWANYSGYQTRRFVTPKGGLIRESHQNSP